MPSFQDSARVRTDTNRTTSYQSLFHLMDNGLFLDQKIVLSNFGISLLDKLNSCSKGIRIQLLVLI